MNDEIAFHNILKKKYSYLIQPFTTKKGEEKKDLYKLSPILLVEFNNYLRKNNDNTNNLEKYIAQQMTNLTNQYLISFNNNFCIPNKKKSHKKLKKINNENINIIEKISNKKIYQNTKKYKVITL